MWTGIEYNLEQVRPLFWCWWLHDGKLHGDGRGDWSHGGICIYL